MPANRRLSETDFAQEAETRTHLDRQGEPAEAGTAHSVGRPGEAYHAKHRVTDKAIFDNRLIFGDNLLALKALEAEWRIT